MLSCTEWYARQIIYISNSDPAEMGLLLSIGTLLIRLSLSIYIYILNKACPDLQDKIHNWSKVRSYVDNCHGPCLRDWTRPEGIGVEESVPPAAWGTLHVMLCSSQHSLLFWQAPWMRTLPGLCIGHGVKPTNRLHPTAQEMLAAT